MDALYLLRIACALLASCVVAFCTVNLVWVRSSVVRKFRVGGLGFLCAAIAWGTTARRDEEFKPWLIPLLLGLLLSFYGMMKTAPHEQSKVKVKSPESL